MRRRPILPLIVGLFLWACSDPVDAPSDGILAVSTSTSGDDPDPDGFQLTIDGIDALALLPSGAAELDLSPGRHTLRLLGVAQHCSVTPGASVEVDIAARSTTQVAFQVSCHLTGARITVTTTGRDIDLDGYQVVAEGSDGGAIASNGTVFTKLDPGSWTIGLAGLASNCAFEGARTHRVTIITAEVASIEFVVVCTAVPPPPGVLAFSTLPGSNLAVVNVDGTNFRELTTHGADQFDLGAAWSPGGERIVFFREIHDPGNPGGIYLINPDGTNLVRLTPSPLQDLEPTWSPDGQQIAFTNITQGLYTDAAYQIYVMNADGSHRVPITRELGGASSPTWSPDGKKIAFQGFGNGVSQTFHLYVMDADGANVSELTEGTRQNPEPAWSPDGSQIVFSNGNAILLINADGTHRRRLTSPPTGTWSYHDSEPAWSPEGEQIVFRRRYDCDPYNDNGGPPCVFDELRSIKLSEPSVSSLVTRGWQPSWGPPAPQ